jgi:hypothetical protein
LAVLGAKAEAAEKMLLGAPAEEFERQFIVRRHDGALQPEARYVIRDAADAIVAYGISDAEGRTIRLYTADRSALAIERA